MPNRHRIPVLVGPVRTGKTTRLMTRAARDPLFGGVASPQEGATRWFRDLRDLAAVPMDASEDLPEDSVLSVGRFRFRKAAFAWAASRMDRALADPDLRCIVLDELGPLELRGMGFAPWLPGWIEAHGPRLLLVVRDTALEEIAERFAFTPQAEPG